MKLTLTQKICFGLIVLLPQTFVLMAVLLPRWLHVPERVEACSRACAKVGPGRPKEVLLVHGCTCSWTIEVKP